VMLLSRVRGLPALTDEGARRLGTVRALTVDAGTGTVTHVRIRRGLLRGETAAPWRDVAAVTEDRVVIRAGTGEAARTGEPEQQQEAPHRELLGCRVLTETGEERGTVLDAAFDPVTGRIETIRTSRTELRADRMLGLGDYALVVRATRADRI